MSSVESTKKSLKEQIMDEAMEKLMEKLQEMVKQKVQEELKKHQDTTNKKKKNLRTHRNNKINSEGTSTNTKVK
jgi:fatty acid/phospholipid biosynthesis enzyme